MRRRRPRSTLFPYTTLFRSARVCPSPLRRTWKRRSARSRPRSEEHTSELQSRPHLVCRLLLEKKKNRLDPALLQHLLGAPVLRTSPYLHFHLVRNPPPRTAL